MEQDNDRQRKREKVKNEEQDKKIKELERVMEVLKDKIAELELEAEVWKEDREERKRCEDKNKNEENNNNENRDKDAGKYSEARYNSERDDSMEGTEEEEEKFRGEKEEEKKTMWYNLSVSSYEEEVTVKKREEKRIQAEEERELNEEKSTQSMKRKRAEEGPTWKIDKNLGLFLVKGPNWPEREKLKTLEYYVGEDNVYIERCVSCSDAVKIFAKDGRIYDRIWKERRNWFDDDILIVDHLLTKEEREKRNKMINKARELKREAKLKGIEIRTMVERDRILIESEWHYWDDEREDLVPENPAKDMREVIEKKLKERRERQDKF